MDKQLLKALSIFLMCRFVAYLGRKPVLIKTVLTEWPNSLITQSKLAKESTTCLNGDGFGLGWYNREIDAEPALFRSVRPAWNDANLLSIASKVVSNCCLAHIRASTVGDVSLANCHPFSYNEFLFVHNGTIQNFSSIRKKLLFSLKEPYFNEIKGQTDSEHLFIKLMEEIEGKPVTTDTLFQALKKTIQFIAKLFAEIGMEANFRINAALTNGQIMAVIRYSHLAETLPHTLYFSPSILPEALLIASEKLTEGANTWKEIPSNHVLLIEENLSYRLNSLY